MRMTTTEQLAQKMMFDARLTEQQVLAALHALGSTLLAELQQGRAVELRGFGLFERATRNDGSHAVRFRQHNAVKEVLNR